MERTFDANGRLVRGRWLPVLAEPAEWRAHAERSWVHITPVRLQLARAGAIVPLVLADVCWFRDDGGAFVTSTSFLARAHAREDAIRILRAPQMARTHRRPMPPARWQLRLPGHAASAEQLPSPPPLSEPAWPGADMELVSIPLDPANIHVHRWERLQEGACDAQVRLSTLELSVLNGERFELAMVADLRLRTPAQRTLAAGRVLVSGTNRKAMEAVAEFAGQLRALTAPARCQAENTEVAAFRGWSASPVVPASYSSPTVSPPVTG